ncbi:MAG: DUF4886 domain-containing protein [Clostridia bacterium]|nr:DUF4886 domain-containing protein [Clostridia bacterium]
MKKLLAFALVLTMMLSLAACGGNKPDNDGNDGTVTTTTASSTAAEDTTTGTEAEGTTTGTEAEGTTTGTEAEGTTTGTEAPTTAAKTEGTTTGTKAENTTKTEGATTTTKAPTTTTTSKVDNRPQIKILSIGHSFSVDAMKTYMWDLFDAAGYNATIAYLYYPGCSLERQYHYIHSNSASYERYSKNINGKWEDKPKARVQDALFDEDWDIVTFQPSPDYGAGTMTYKCEWGCNAQVNDYDHFTDMVDHVKALLYSHGNKDVKFYYHLTWAFASDCRLWSFTYSGFDQLQMFKDFWAATKKYVLTNKDIKGVIPCITSIQNVRTSFMGDTFNEPGNYDPKADGYHLNDKGDLVAAMTWVAYFTGKDPMDFKIGCKYSDTEYEAMAEAVRNAIRIPYYVRESSYK